MSNAQLSTIDAMSLQAIPDQVVGLMRESFTFVMKWQAVDLPSRFALGCGDMRKLTLHIRRQPANLMIITHQSLTTARDGQYLCRRGVEATRILLSVPDEDRQKRDRPDYVLKSLEEITTSASDLNNHTREMHQRLRLLRSVILGIHRKLNDVSTKQERPDFLFRWARQFKNVRACEEALLKIAGDIQKIEDSLDHIILWWQTVESQAHYLLKNGKSPLTSDQNTVMLEDINRSFTRLERYFADYMGKMSRLYDDNINILNSNELKHLKKIQGGADLTISSEGRLERPTQ